MSELLLAMLAGVLTIAAPCILPMLPILLGASVAQQDRSRPLFIAAGFVTAFSAFALLFGAFSAAIAVDQETLRDGAIALLMLFGLLMLWQRPLALLTPYLGAVINRASAAGDRTGPGKLGGLLLGATLGVVWTPCAGPALGAILTLVASARDLGRAGLLLLSYAGGAGVPMLLIAYGGQVATTRVRSLARHAARMQQGFGVLIMLTALAMYTQYDTVLTLWLSDLLPQPG